MNSFFLFIVLVFLATINIAKPEEVPAQSIEQLVNTHEVMIFSKSYCPWCKRTKQLFEEMGIEFHALELDQIGEIGKQIQTQLAEVTGQRTVPNVWIKGKFIGGFDVTQRLKDEGQLLKLLNREAKEDL